MAARLRTLLRRLLGRRRMEQDLDDEVRAHFEILVERRMERGLSRDEAARAVRVQFEGAEQVKEKVRDARAGAAIETTLRDIHYAWRTLRKSPGFAVVAVLTLALGIGANTAIFSVIKAVLLNQLPFEDPDRLVVMGEADSGERRPETVGFTTAYDWRRLSHSFKGMSLYRDAAGVIVEGPEPELIRGMRVNYDFFDTLGIPIALGRGFLPSEDQPGTRHEVILSHSLWVRRFGSDPHIIGRSLRLSDAPFRVVGVLSTDLQDVRIPGSSGDPELFEPLGYALTDPFACRDCQHLHLVARLTSGVTLDKARAEMAAIMADLVRQYPGSYPAGARVAIEPLHPYVVGRVSTALWVLLGAVGFVLLIACANVANLTLVRAAGRAKEISMRAALGASRARLTRQLFTESMLLALLGGAAGVLIAGWCLSALVSFAPKEIPRLSEIHVDLVVLYAGLAASLLTGVLCGLAPAIRASRVDLNDTLKNVAKAARSHSRWSLSNILVTTELVLAFLLVVGAGLLGQSFVRLTRVEPGYDPTNVLTLKTYVYGTRYRDSAVELNYYRQALNRIRTIPGIEDAAMTSALPLVDFDRYGFHIRDHLLERESDAPSADTYSVSSSYFAVMKIPLKRGRLFTERDDVNAPPVAVISETCAREEFPNADPIGKQIQLGGRSDTKSWITIVGIVGDVRQYALETAPRMAAYIAQPQDLSFAYSLVARLSVDPSRVERAVRAAFLSADPSLPIYQFRTMEAYLGSSLAQRRFTLTLLTIFSGIALALAAVGVYGVISYRVTLRTREVGIRMALGAERRDVLRMVLRQGAAVAAIGLAFGFMLSLALMRVLSSLLFEAGRRDQATTAAAALLLLCVVLTASYLPARRAAGVDPMKALRNE